MWWTEGYLLPWVRIFSAPALNLFGQSFKIPVLAQMLKIWFPFLDDFTWKGKKE